MDWVGSPRGLIGGQYSGRSWNPLYRLSFAHGFSGVRELEYPVMETIERNGAIPIERAYAVTRETFHERYLSESGKPVIITDALNTWKARSKWSFDWFKSRYGSDMVLPTADCR